MSDTTTVELNKIMTEALFQLTRLVDNDASKKHDLIMVVKTFLLGIISTLCTRQNFHAATSKNALHGSESLILSKQFLKASDLKNKLPITSTR